MTEQPTPEAGQVPALTIDIESIKARLATASQGSWQQISGPMDGGDPDGFYVESDATGLVCFVDPGRLADAEFIAHAPTDIAALLAALEASEAERLLKGQFDALHYLLREQHARLGHNCFVGCPLYSSGYSISADGHCNMGCC